MPTPKSYGSGLYSSPFYDAIADGCRISASIVAPIITEIVKPKSMADVGCGQGWWALAFEELGVEAIGYDGDWVEVFAAPAFVEMDLSLPFSVAPCDLVVSLEVAEHLPPSRAAGFVEDLTDAAPRVLFSAAQPGQEGVGHINCQPPQFWVDLFAARGYICRDLRSVIWEDKRIEPWYRANMLLFSKESDEPVAPSKIEARWPDDMWRPA